MKIKYLATQGHFLTIVLQEGKHSDIDIENIERKCIKMEQD